MKYYLALSLSHWYMIKFSRNYMTSDIVANQMQKLMLETTTAKA